MSELTRTLKEKELNGHNYCLNYYEHDALPFRILKDGKEIETYTSLSRADKEFIKIK